MFALAGALALVLLILVLTLAAASIPPAWRASRLKVVEALSHV